MKHDITASALIISDNKILLLFHKKLQCWLYPGGHVEPDEDPIMAVKREVAEETGLMVKVAGSFDAELATPTVEPLPLPVAILREVVNDKQVGEHIHVDLIYQCDVIGGQLMDVGENEKAR
jgi:8-oxo-dGTP diphosphatase